MSAAVPDGRIVDAVTALVTSRLPGTVRKPFVLGICGAQGSGKSTLACAMVPPLEASGLRVAVLSLDDLYLPRIERRRLAREVHPLLATRGPPGTHDVALGLAVIAALERGEPAPLPRFDKGGDDRMARENWPRAPENCDVLLIEGWCVGARAQDEGMLGKPVNALEREKDPSCSWRRYVNAALAGPYQKLFARLDALVLLAAPGFEVVHGWRLQQENDLRSQAGEGVAVMDGAGIARFIQHYERLTRHMLCEMPARADVVVRLGADRSPVAIEIAD